MSSTLSQTLGLFAFFVAPGLGDVYLQSMPGSNNRLDEQNRERANGNRLFDSENNNRGGYNVGKMRYYHREKIPVAWTNQHGTQKYQMEHSEMIGQYKCDPLMRDGTTTQTIPKKATECYNYDCDTDVRFGRHESLDYYTMCERTRRNKGLFTINQNLKGQGAIYTRQNPQGTRHGYECPEERDYYPYDRDNGGWIDAFVLTADPAKCDAYQAESQNVKSRWQCEMPEAFYDAGGYLSGNQYLERNKEDCEQLQVTVDDTTYTAEWVEKAAYGVDAPDCQTIAQTRANHLGNPGGRDIYEYQWEIPDTIMADSICVFRLRYNITTGDYPAFASGASIQAGLNVTSNHDHVPNGNGERGVNPGNDPSEYPIWEDYGLTREDVEESFANGNNDGDSREYVLENNPQPNAFGDLLDGKTSNTNAIKMQLAINTAQYGRTFQDRSHTFTVMARPGSIPEDAQIIQQTVRGKRGNIVQTFPATEYFFYPPENYIPQGEYMHVHWTGSNTNPNNNDGQGKQGTDRSNICCTRTNQYETTLYSNFESDMTFEDGVPDRSNAMVSYPAYAAEPEGYVIPTPLQSELLSDPTCLGLDEDTMKLLCTTRQGPHDYGNMEELDDAGASFETAPIQMNTKGCWNIIGTRNNNFSNRDQKGKICGSDGDVGNLMVSAAGASWHDSTQRSGVTFWQNAVAGMERAHLVVREGERSAELQVMDLNIVGTITVDVGYTPKAMHTASMMWQAECEWAVQVSADGCTNEWEPIAFESVILNDGHVAQADVQNTGTFKVIQEPNWAPILALTVALLAFVIALGFVLYKKGFCAALGESGYFLCCSAMMSKASGSAKKQPQWNEPKEADLEGNTSIQAKGGPAKVKIPPAFTGSTGPQGETGRPSQWMAD